mgnify:CR=1 FL=1
MRGLSWPWSQATNAAGAYTFALVKPGQYDLTVTAAGQVTDSGKLAIGGDVSVSLSASGVVFLDVSLAGVLQENGGCLEPVDCFCEAIRWGILVHAGLHSRSE